MSPTACSPTSAIIATASDVSDRPVAGRRCAADVDAVQAAAVAAGADPWSLVLSGGEDHALAACFPGPVPDGWRVIGAVRDGPAGCWWTAGVDGPGGLAVLRLSALK